MVNFKPILFSAPMVRAILEGRKTMTRRIIKTKYSNTDICRKEDKYGKRLIERQNDAPEDIVVDHGNGKTTTTRHLIAYREIPVKYKIGDILWVRETWLQGCEWDGNEPMPPLEYYYKTDAKAYEMEWYDEDREDGIRPNGPRWKPSIHMPKAACRLFLEVVARKEERLLDITEQDAIAEGVERILPFGDMAYRSYAVPDGGGGVYPYVSFKTLWQKINGAESWEANPWVRAVSFKRIERPDNFLTPQQYKL